MNNGEEKIFAYWIINSVNNGTKSIWMYLGEVDDGSEYYYKIRISNSDFPKSKYVPSEEETKIEQERKKRLNDTKNNSF